VRAHEGNGVVGKRWFGGPRGRWVLDVDVARRGLVLEPLMIQFFRVLVGSLEYDDGFPLVRIHVQLTISSVTRED
jgi:hypothetical protein